MHYYPIIALDLARERSLEAERRARLLRGARPLARSLPRRLLGRLASWAGAARSTRAGADRAAIPGGTAA